LSVQLVAPVQGNNAARARNGVMNPKVYSYMQALYRIRYSVPGERNNSFVVWASSFEDAGKRAEAFLKNGFDERCAVKSITFVMSAMDIVAGAPHDDAPKCGVAA